MSSVFWSAHSFSSGGDLRQSPSNALSKLNLLFFGFAILVTTTNYTAAVTSEAVIAREAVLASFAAALSDDNRVCCPDVLLQPLTTRYGNVITNRCVPFNTSDTLGMLDAMDSGVCVATVTSINAWNVEKVNHGHCTTKHVLPETVFDIGNSSKPKLAFSKTRADTLCPHA